MLRFQITNPVGEVAVAYRLDRLTGKVYMLGLGKEIAVKRVPSDSIQGWEIKSFQLTKKGNRDTIITMKTQTSFTDEEK